MATGASNKWHGTQIKLMTGFGGSSGSKIITGITKANPPHVTSTAHGLETGDVITITDVVGMTDVNGGTFIVEYLTSSTFALADIDATGYGAYVSGGSLDVAEFSNFCELTNYNRQGGTSAEIPATSLCSVAKEFVIDLPDFGTTALDFKFDPLLSTPQVALHEFYLSGEVTAVHVTLPNSRGDMVLLGYVQQESEQAGNGTLWTASATIRNTGNRYDFLPA
jgi:hypothetical protein